MNYKLFLKQAIVDKGPIRKGNLYKTFKTSSGEEFVCVEDFKKSLIVKVDTNGVLKEVEIPKYDPEKAKEMLLGKRFYPELSSQEFLSNQEIIPFSFNKEDFITLLESFGETIKKEQGPVFVTLFELFLDVTIEGIESSYSMSNHLDPNVDDDANKISAYLIYPFHLLAFTGRSYVSVNEIIESFDKSVELSKYGINSEKNWSDAISFYKRTFDFYVAENEKDNEDDLEFDNEETHGFSA